MAPANQRSTARWSPAAALAASSSSSTLICTSRVICSTSPIRKKRSEAARDWADSRREALLKAKTGFVSETVFSHESKLALIMQARAMGFDVVLYVVSLDDPQRLLPRVSQRVREGGHNVPAQRILERYPRTMANLKKAVRLVDLAFIYDAAEVEQGAHLLVAMCEREQTTLLVTEQPIWVLKLLG